VESIIIAKNFATKHNYSVSANRELVAYGLANMASSLFGAILVLITLTVLLPLFALLPKVVMSAIIVNAAFKLFEFEEFQYLYKIREWRDLAVMTVTIFTTITFGLEVGLVVSILMSLFLIVKQSAAPLVTIRGRIPSSDVFYDLATFRDINLFTTKHEWFTKTTQLADKGNNYYSLFSHPFHKES
jgi:MFS superfamily sulfate permease-like transporter